MTVIAPVVFPIDGRADAIPLIEGLVGAPIGAPAPVGAVHQVIECHQRIPLLQVNASPLLDPDALADLAAGLPDIHGACAGIPVRVGVDFQNNLIGLEPLGLDHVDPVGLGLDHVVDIGGDIDRDGSAVAGYLKVRRPRDQLVILRLLHRHRPAERAVLLLEGDAAFPRPVSLVERDGESKGLLAEPLGRNQLDPVLAGFGNHNVEVHVELYFHVELLALGAQFECGLRHQEAVLLILADLDHAAQAAVFLLDRHLRLAGVVGFVGVDAEDYLLRIQALRLHVFHPAGAGGHLEFDIRADFDRQGMAFIREMVFGRADEQAVELRLLDADGGREASSLLLDGHLSFAVVVGFVFGDVEHDGRGGQAFRRAVFDPVLAAGGHFHAELHVGLHRDLEFLRRFRQFERRLAHHEAVVGRLRDIDRNRLFRAGERDGAASLVVGGVRVAGYRDAAAGRFFAGGGRDFAPGLGGGGRPGFVGRQRDGLRAAGVGERQGRLVDRQDRFFFTRRQERQTGGHCQHEQEDLFHRIGFSIRLSYDNSGNFP